MAGLMETFGFMPPGMSPYGSLGGMPGAYQPDPQTLMLQQQLQRQSQGPAPLPMPPGMVSPFAFAPGTQQGMGQSVAPGLAAFGQMAPSALQGPSSAPMPVADAPAPQAANAGPAPAPSAVMAAAGNSGFPMPPEGRSQGSIDRQRRMAESLMQQGMSSAPIGHWTQGGARLVQALSGSVLNNRADADEKSNQKANREFLANLLGGGGASGNPTAGAAVTPGNNPAQQAITRTAGPAKSGPQTVETAGRLMSDLQRDFGLTPQQAAGVAGNLAHESGGFRTLQEIRPVVPGSRGGFGYAQWTGPRRVAFENWSRQNGLDPTSYEANYGFLKHELQNTGEGRVLGALRQAPDVGTATQIFSNQFLRPGIPAMGSRMAFAQQFGNLAGQQGAQAPQMPGQQGAPQSPAPAMGGAPMPQQGITPRAPGIAGMDPQRLLLAAAFTNDPNMKQTLGALAQMQAQQGRVQYQTLPDGTILALDPSGRRPPTPVYQAPTKPTFGVIGKDQFGNEQYGFIDPATRQIQPTQLQQQQQAQGQVAGSPGAPQAPATVAAPGAATAPGAPAPAGAVQGIPPAPPGVDPKVWRTEQTKKLANPDKLTEVQSKDVGFYKRGIQANELLNGKEGDLLNTPQAILGSVPLVGNQLTGASLQGKKYQAANQAARDFLAVILRKDTGAAVTPQEFSMYGDIFLPKPGDGPEVVAQKRQARERAMEGIRSGLGTAKDIVEYARPKPKTPANPDILKQARDAIAKGAPREKVIERMRQNGIDPGGL